MVRGGGRWWEVVVGTGRWWEVVEGGGSSGRLVMLRNNKYLILHCSIIVLVQHIIIIVLNACNE